MHVIHHAEQKTVQRPDGRTVASLLDLAVGLPVDRAAALFVEHPADFTERRHFHEHLYEIFYFLDDADYWVDHEVIQLKAGDLLVLEPGNVHGALPVADAVRILVFHLPMVPGDKVEVGDDEPAIAR